MTGAPPALTGAPPVEASSGIPDDEQLASAMHAAIVPTLVHRRCAAFISISSALRYANDLTSSRARDNVPKAIGAGALTSILG
jgi:hypothetical protein